jgi:hypothetical protein
MYSFPADLPLKQEKSLAGEMAALAPPVEREKTNVASSSPVAP